VSSAHSKSELPGELQDLIGQAALMAWPKSGEVEVPKTGRAVLDRGTDKDICPQWYEDVPDLLKNAQEKPNFLINQTLNAPAQVIIDTFKGAIIAPGDPATRVHPQVACGMVKKDTDGLIQTIYEVEWSPEKIHYTFATNAMAAGIPPFGCCMTGGVGGDVTVTILEENKCRFEERGFVIPRRCGPLLCCCCCLCWGPIVTKVLNGQLKAAESKWQKENPSSQPKDTE